MSILKYSTLIDASHGGPSMSRPNLKSVKVGLKPVLLGHFFEVYFGLPKNESFS